jgi:hypothetical protein
MELPIHTKPDQIIGPDQTKPFPSQFNEPRENLMIFKGPGRERDNLLTGEGEGVGVEPNHTTTRKPGPLNSILYSLNEPVLTCQAGAHEMA